MIITGLPIVMTIVLSLLALITMFVVTFLLKSLFIGMSLSQVLSKHQIIFYFIILVLTLGTLIAFSLLEGVFLSRTILLRFASEFLNSMAFFVVFWTVWMILDKPIVLRRVILVGLLGLLIKLWNTESFTYSRSIDFRVFFTTQYQQLKSLLGRRLTKACLDMCQIPTIFSEDYLIFYDGQNPGAQPIPIVIKDIDPEYLLESVKEAKKRIVNFIPEESFLLRQLAPLKQLSEDLRDF